MSHIVVLVVFAALVGRQTAELVTGAEDLPADQCVAEERAEDADPDEQVVSVDADVVPLAVDPAPDLIGVSTVG